MPGALASFCQIEASEVCSLGEANSRQTCSGAVVLDMTNMRTTYDVLRL